MHLFHLGISFGFIHVYVFASDFKIIFLCCRMSSSQVLAQMKKSECEAPQGLLQVWPMKHVLQIYILFAGRVWLLPAFLQVKDDLFSQDQEVTQELDCVGWLLLAMLVNSSLYFSGHGRQVSREQFWETWSNLSFSILWQYLCWGGGQKLALIFLQMKFSVLLSKKQHVCAI